MNRKKPIAKPKGYQTNHPKNQKGFLKDLKLPDGGCLVYACIGNYQGKGETRVILHEAELGKLGGYAYGHKKTWNFPLDKKAGGKK